MKKTNEVSKKNKSQTKLSKTATNFYKRSTKALTENQLAVEETKKLYQKYYEMPNQLFISQLKTETINIYLSNYKLNDISVINKILSKYKFTKHLTLSPIDPNKTNSKKIRERNSREPITEGEKVKLEKEQKDKKIEYSVLINKITLGVGKHLFQNEKLESFSILNLEFDQKLAQNLSVGICNNNSIKILKINNCNIDISSYELLLKGLFNHKAIQTLDLQKNNFDDKYGNMIGRIISRQTDRRDQLIWLSAIRNEFPNKEEISKGLISMNLSNNNLSSYSADCITTALALDQYVRSINLSNNQFDSNACKKFIYMLRKNMSLLNIDLKGNPGYNDNIQKRIIIKMSKNIKNLYNKFQDKEISVEEFESYKKYINSSMFFNIDIPEDIVENYNNNVMNKLNENDDNNDINVKNIADNNKENGMVLKNEKKENNLNNSINKIDKNDKKNTRGISISNNKQATISDEETKKLIEENLSLKEEIIKLKSENIKNKSGKNINLPNKYKGEILNKNFKQVEELLDKLNALMNKMESEEHIKEEKKKNSEKKESENNKIKIQNIVLNDKKEEDIKIDKEKKKEKPREKEKPKEKKEIKLNIDDNNKNIFKKEDKKEGNDIKKDNNNNINNIIIKEKKETNKINNKNINNSDKKENDINNKIINKKEENKKNDLERNKKLELFEKEEEKENDESDNLDENDEALLQHRMIFEQLKKEYAKKGLKFEMDDYLELLENQDAFQEEEENDYEGF